MVNVRAIIKEGMHRTRTRRSTIEYTFTSRLQVCITATKDSGEFSGCMIIYPMSSIDQSVLRKVGFELIQRRRKGGVIRFLNFRINQST